MKLKLICIQIGLVTWCLFGCTSKDTGGTQKKESDNIAEEPVQTPESKPQPLVELTVRTTGNTLNEMSYDLKEISVQEGSRLKITLINQAQDSAMIHNIVFVYDGTRNATAIAGLKAGPDKGYVPDLLTVIAASELAKPGETVTLEFVAPGPGSYYYICTYPGHWQKMTGVFKVTAAT